MNQYRVPIDNLRRALPEFGQTPPRLRLVTDGDSLRFAPARPEDGAVEIDDHTGDLVRRSQLVSKWETDPTDPDFLLCTVEEVVQPYRPG